MQSINSQFTHFKVHTQYSICEGALKIDNLKNFCKENKIRSIGLSDTSNLCGALEFSENISKTGTQPIIGTQILYKHNDLFGLIPLIAKNENGYKNIIKLSSSSYLNTKDGSLPFCSLKELLENQTNDIIILSGSINGFFGRMFNKGKIDDIRSLYQSFKKKFRDNFYIEIQRHDDQNEKAFEIFNLNESKINNIPIIASHEVFYLDKSMSEAHDVLMCIGSKTYLNEKNRIKLSNQHYLKSDEEMKKIFNDLPEALTNNYNLPLRCSFRPLPSKPILPNITTSNNLNAEEKLKKESLEGLINKFKLLFDYKKNEIKNSETYIKYKKRLDHEIKIIINMKYSSYFLIVSDYIKWAKQSNIPVGPGRGSGAGSLVAWCLDITDVDPIKFNLIFERFLNPDRVSMPDFDVDFCEEKRDLVFEYLKTKYKDSVAHIITFGKLKARMVIRDVGRVLGLPYGFVDSICKMIPFDPSRPMNLSECIDKEPRLQKLIIEDKRVKRLVDLSLKLEGLNRNVATHAAGVVIADKKLTETVPLYKDSSLDLLLPSTQFDMYSAENAGLVKFDFLGLKTLTIINKTQEIINKKNKEFKIEKICYEDKKVYDLLSSGKTVGLFQLESSGMREALTQMKPNRLEDIIALVALYRPGPMSNIPIYNDCKHGKIKPDYLHPKLQKILEPTYGVIIYQEQVMQIAQELSGFTAGEADLLRRAMGKKKRLELERQKQRFIDGAVERGIAKEIAASIFLKIEPFAEYGFNKSHAAAYAIIAYQTAYLKTHYKLEFFAASMSMEQSNQNKLSEFYEELKRLNIEIERPNINKCFADFHANNEKFLYSLGSLKNVGYEAISNIVKERIRNGEFKSINNFIERTNPKNINKLQLEGLVKSGAFDVLNNNRKSLFDSIPNLILKSKNFHENISSNQIDLFGSSESENDNIINDTNDWSLDERLSKEFETLGFFISDHPLSQFKSIYNNYNIINYEEFNSNDDIKEGNVASTVLKIQEKKTQKGTSYAILKLSDLSGTFELFVFSDLFEMNRNILKEGNSILVTLFKNILDKQNGNRRTNIKKITSLKDVINKPINKAIFTINDLAKAEELKKLLINGGHTEVELNIIHKNQKLIFKIKEKKKVDRNLINTLKNKDIFTSIS